MTKTTFKCGILLDVPKVWRDKNQNSIKKDQQPAIKCRSRKSELKSFEKNVAAGLLDLCLESRV